MFNVSNLNPTKMKSRYILVFMCFFTAASYAQTHIIVGTGGGYSGIVNLYKISLDGHVDKASGMGELKFTEHGMIKKSDAKKYIRAVAEQIENNHNFLHPGNDYYFLTYNDGITERRITWGDKTKPISEDVQAVFQELNNHLKGIEFNHSIDDSINNPLNGSLSSR